MTNWKILKCTLEHRPSGCLQLAECILPGSGGVTPSWVEGKGDGQEPILMQVQSPTPGF